MARQVVPGASSGERTSSVADSRVRRTGSHVVNADRRISPPRFVTECRTRRYNSGQFYRIRVRRVVFSYVSFLGFLFLSFSLSLNVLTSRISQHVGTTTFNLLININLSTTEHFLQTLYSLFLAFVEDVPVRMVLAHRSFWRCAFRLRNDLYCVGWGVKLYSLTGDAPYKPSH